MVSPAIFSSIFWAIMVIAFGIIYYKGREFTENYEDAINPVGKKILLWPDGKGGYYQNDARETLKPALEATKSIFKLSGYALILSIIAVLQPLLLD